MFKLTAKYKPTGDQPEAIEKLANGLKSGKKHQVLLGVTGSGKSVVRSTTVLVRYPNGTVKNIEIGKLTDDILDKFSQNIKVIDDSMIIETNDLPDNYHLETYSFDPHSKETSWKIIKQFIRHESPKKIYRVKTNCGREVTVTGDHNFYVLRNGELALSKTELLNKKDYIPVPLNLPPSEKLIESIYIPDYLNTKEFYIALPEFSEDHNWKEQLSPILGYFKTRAVLTAGERISFAKYKELANLRPDISTQVKIGLIKKNIEIPLSLGLSDNFLRLLGYYIGEGHAEKNYFIISSGDQQIIKDFQATLNILGIKSALRPETYDYSVFSGLLSRLLSNLCGKNSKDKHLPDFWLNLSNKQLAQILSAYFSTDGGVDGLSVSCTTASQQLASELALALLRFGIAARIRKRLIKIPNKNKRGTYWTIAISGQKFLTLFQNNIGFVLEKKSKKLKDVIKPTYNTNVDIIPINRQIKETRVKLGLSQLDISRYCNVTRSLISLIENGKRMPSRAVFEKIMQFLEKNAKDQQDILRDIQKVKSHSLLYWSPIKEIAIINYHDFVYDFSVEGNETFLAGHGGMFVHNTFTMAQVIAKYDKPTLIVSHNKTLAAQLYKEFKEFFPKNAVHYFVSYYDYYQPEAYIPHTNTYIEKDSKINEEIDRLRHAATQALMSRNDVIVIASVSCIYNLGSPEEYKNMGLEVFEGQKITPEALVSGLTRLQYTQDIELKRGCFRKTRNEIELMGPDGQNVFKLTLGDGKIIRLKHADITEPEVLETTDPKFERILEAVILPAKYWITSDSKIAIAIENIKSELQKHTKVLKKQKKFQEANRLYEKTMQDIDMMKKTGYCHGIENYSRHLDFRKHNDPPYTLLDFFISKGEYLTIIDESHISIPQVRGMFHGDHSRKSTLVEYGFRLPSAIDNRPLKFTEFEKRIQKTVYVSATPGEYELKKAGKDNIAEQLIRPTGLLDPTIQIEPTENQIPHLIEEIKKRVAKKERVIATTLTKRMAEDLSEHLAGNGIKVNYLHSEIKTLDRLKILKDFRLGNHDVLIGVNLLREGLDLPEVSLIAILDADKEGFLRNTTTLIQTMGRAARHVNGHVIMYADKITRSIKSAVGETRRRRATQDKHNKANNITPKSILKSIGDYDLPISNNSSTRLTTGGVAKIKRWGRDEDDAVYVFGSMASLTTSTAKNRVIVQLTKMMDRAARKMEYDKALVLREQIRKIKNGIV